MEAQANFNKRTARLLDVDALTSRNAIGQGRPILLTFRSANSRSRLTVAMTEREAMALAAELYAMTDSRADKLQRADIPPEPPQQTH